MRGFRDHFIAPGLARPDFDAETAALRAEAAVREAALNPLEGWWRQPNGGRVKRPILRRSAVMDALSVGCSPRQIADASGARLVDVWNARECAMRGQSALHKLRRIR